MTRLLDILVPRRALRWGRLTVESRDWQWLVVEGDGVRAMLLQPLTEQPMPEERP